MGGVVEVKVSFAASKNLKIDLIVWPCFQENKGKKKSPLFSKSFEKKDTSILKDFSNFTADKDQTFKFYNKQGLPQILIGLGPKEECSNEKMRKIFANLYKKLFTSYSSVQINSSESLYLEDKSQSFQAICESLFMTSYSFNQYKKSSKPDKLKTIIFNFSSSTESKIAQESLHKAEILGRAINFSRDLVNMPPNDLNSETYAKLIEKDSRKLKNVKIKILGKAELKKEKMNMFLAVNAGSAYAPRLVHLTYTPKKANNKTKHVIFVGKGLTFDTGGYSLKPSTAMINMKFDMAGSSTVYAAFKAAAELELPIKMTCLLGMTDNALSALATVPDSIVTARNGKTVEILNTDAEGRLVLGDVLDYACDMRPDAIIDAATLTGNVLLALGHEICGLMGNNSDLNKKLLEAAKKSDEYVWELPLIPEFSEDIKSTVADIKNIANSRYGGTSKAAAFLSTFVKEDINWAHLDIAGIGDAQSHLPYCPAKGASGLIVRTLVSYLENV